MIAQALVKQNKHRYTNITLRGVVRRTTSTFMKQIASGTSTIPSSSGASK